MTPADLRTFLNRLCDVAEQKTLPHFRSATAVSNKRTGGFDPVTEADRGAERAIREEIGKAWPDHGIQGEEEGPVNSDAQYQWIIDPVDGTRAFVSGIPVWGTLIGLYKDGSPMAGVMDQPFTGERFLCDGQAVTLARRDTVTDLKTSRTAKLEDAILMTTAPELYSGSDTRKFRQIAERARLVRYGTDCYAFCMLAAGHVDIVIEAGLQLYDFAALVPIVEKAGGVFTDWDGNPNPGAGKVVAAANPQLHDAALAALAG